MTGEPPEPLARYQITTRANAHSGTDRPPQPVEAKRRTAQAWPKRLPVILLRIASLGVIISIFILTPIPSNLFGPSTFMQGLLLGFTPNLIIVINMIPSEIWAKLRVRPGLAGISARILTGLAALLAGSKRRNLREEWAAHLAGDSGHDPASWQKARQACGFLASAIRFRCSDTANVTWIPADAILKSHALSNLVVLTPTAAATFFILRHAGTLGVLESAASITAIGAALYALIHAGRSWRDANPPEPKARRPKNDT